MSVKSVLVFAPDLGSGVALTIDGTTAVELSQYILGYYESLFTTLPVAYTEGKRAFLIEVLCNGYTECTLVDSWPASAEVIKVDLETLTPTDKNKLDHRVFGDPPATQLMLKKFTSLL